MNGKTMVSGILGALLGLTMMTAPVLASPKETGMLPGLDKAAAVRPVEAIGAAKGLTADPGVASRMHGQVLMKLQPTGVDATLKGEAKALSARPARSKGLAGDRGFVQPRAHAGESRL